MSLASIITWMISCTFSFKYALAGAPEPEKAATDILAGSGRGTRAQASLSGPLKGNSNLDGVESMDSDTKPWILQVRLRVLQAIGRNVKLWEAFEGLS